MLRRLLALLVAVLALVATGQASATTLVCMAEAQERVCHCDHAAMQSMAEDDCCNGQKQTVQSPVSFALVAPSVSGDFVAYSPAPHTELSSNIDAFLPPGYAHDAPARAPPVPRFLAFRTLLI